MANTTLYCGAAKRCITPPKELMGSLRGLMNMRYVAVEDDLYVRALVLKSGEETALFVGFDLDKAPYPQESIDYFHKTYGIAPENITYYGIHTHSAPATGLRPKEAFNDPRRRGEEVAKATEDYENYLLPLCYEAVAEAMDSLRPARLSFASEECAVNMNRNLHNFRIREDGSVEEFVSGMSVLGPADHNVYVLRLTDLEGKPLAFLINYAVHNTLMFQNDYDGEGGSAISSDMGGNVSALVEKYNPGAVALWCSGAAGDVGPVNFTRPGRPGRTGEAPKGNPAYLQKLEAMKQAAVLNYAAVVRAMEKMDEGTDTAEIRGAVRFVEVPARKLIRQGEGPGSKVIIDNEAEVPPYRIRLHLLRIGKVAYCGIGGELYSTHAQAIQEALPLKNVVIVNHDASMIDDANYIPDDENIRISDNGVQGSRAWAYKPGFVRPALTDAAVKMMDGLL